MSQPGAPVPSFMPPSIHTVEAELRLLMAKLHRFNLRFQQREQQLERLYPNDPSTRRIKMRDDLKLNDAAGAVRTLAPIVAAYSAYLTAMRAAHASSER